MKVEIIIIVVLSSLICGCASLQGFSDYFNDRCRDIADPWTIGAGYGYGLYANANALIPIGFGYSKTREYGWDGRRNFSECSWHRRSKSFFLPPLGYAYLESVATEDIDIRELRYVKDEKPPENVRYLFFIDSILCVHPRYLGQVRKSSETDEYPLDLFIGVDCTAGLGSLRFNISLSELSDCLMGFALIDILNDDENSNKSNVVQ